MEQTPCFLKTWLPYIPSLSANPDDIRAVSYTHLYGKPGSYPCFLQVSFAYLHNAWTDTFYMPAESSHKYLDVYKRQVLLLLCLGSGVHAQKRSLPALARKQADSLARKQVIYNDRVVPFNTLRAILYWNWRENCLMEAWRRSRCCLLYTSPLLLWHVWIGHY